MCRRNRDRSGVRPLITTRIRCKNRSAKHGCVYILCDKISGQIKIGRTRHPVSARLRDVKKNHERPHTYFYWKCSVLGPGLLQRLEQLVLRDFRHLQKPYICHTCKNGLPRVHGEWFSINPEVAKRTILLWREWLVEKQPYNSDGGLKPEWWSRVQKSYKLMAPFGKPELRFAHWEEFTKAKLPRNIHNWL